MKTIGSIDIILTIIGPFVILFTINISISIKLSHFNPFSSNTSTRLDRNESNRLSIASRKEILHRQNSSTRSHSRNRLSSRISIRPNRFCSVRSSLSSNEEAHKFEHVNNTPSLPSPTSTTITTKNPANPQLGHSGKLTMTVNHPIRRFRSYSRTTRMLIIISITYILLNSLMAYSKLKHLFVTESSSSLRSLNNELLERVSCYLYYLNFSINFFLYVLNKSTFRDILFDVFKRKKSINIVNL